MEPRCLSAMTWGFYSSGKWRDERGVNLFDTGAHFYDTYECADGKFISLASIEPKFYALLREKLGLTGRRSASTRSWTASSGCRSRNP